MAPCTPAGLLQRRSPPQTPEPSKQWRGCHHRIHSSLDTGLHTRPIQPRVHLGAGMAAQPHLDFPDLDAFEAGRPLLSRNVPPFGFSHRFLVWDSGFAPGACGATTRCLCWILSRRCRAVSKCPPAGAVGFESLDAGGVCPEASLCRSSVPPTPPRRVDRDCSPGGALRRSSLPPLTALPRSLSFLSFYRSGLWFPLLFRGFLSVTITLRFDAQMVSGWTRGPLLLCLFDTFPPWFF